MDRFGPTGKVSKKRVHLLRWTNFPGRTGWNFGSMDRARDATSGGVRLKRELTINRSLSQGQKETLPIFSISVIIIMIG